MYSLFDVDTKREYGVVRLPEWKATADGLKRNLVSVIEHHRHASYTVGGDHILVQILQSINVPITLNADRYFSNVSANALSVANSFQLVTPFGSGKLFSGVFFNKNVKEVILAFDEWFDPVKAEANWKDLTPVRVLSHPFTNLGMQVPNGKFVSPEEGVAVIAVNVNLLAVMHRAFRYSEQLKQMVDPSYTQRNTMQFIHMFVLPNMLESYLDYALFNRLDCLWNEMPMYHFAPRSAVYVTDYHRQVNNTYLKLLELLKRSSYSAPQTLAAIPMASVPDMRTVAFVPDVAPTRQILWSVILARLPMLLFLVRTAKKNDTVRNQEGLLNVMTLLTKLKRQRVFDSTLPKELYQQTMGMIDEIISVL